MKKVLFVVVTLIAIVISLTGCMSDEEILARAKEIEAERGTPAPSPEPTPDVPFYRVDYITEREDKKIRWYHICVSPPYKEEGLIEIINMEVKGKDEYEAHRFVFFETGTQRDPDTVTFSLDTNNKDILSFNHNIPQLYDMDYAVAEYHLADGEIKRTY